MAKAAAPAIDLLLPWSSSNKEDKRFSLIVFIFLLLVFVAGIWIQSIKLPEVDRSKIKVPANVAKLIVEKKKEKPKPKPVVQEKKSEEKKPEEKKPEEKKPEEKKVEVKKPTQEQKVKQAQEAAKKVGLLAMKDDLAAMRQAMKSELFSGKSLSNTGAAGVGVSRSVIVGSASGGSGGIQVAAGSSSGSGLGGGSGGRGETNVDSVTLGGTVVDSGGDVAKAIESTKSGNRSEESIRAVLDQNKASLYAIYNRALRENPSLQGKVTFKLVIEPDGSVSACSIVSSGLDDVALGNKLISRMKFIDFGAADVGVTTTQWAIDFLPY
jgi:periplasmic protein TonB